MAVTVIATVVALATAIVIAGANTNSAPRSLRRKLVATVINNSSARIASRVNTAARALVRSSNSVNSSSRNARQPLRPQPLRKAQLLRLQPVHRRTHSALANVESEVSAAAVAVVVAVVVAAVAVVRMAT